MADEKKRPEEEEQSEGQFQVGTQSGNDEGKPGFSEKIKAARIETKAGLAAAVAIVLFGVLFGTHVLCLHQWSEATCTKPSTCRICGATQGKALGHEMEPATCTSPEHCGRCDYKKGKALGHKWVDATCTAPKTCSRCKKTEGSALGHEAGDWSITKEASCTEAGSRETTCKRCGQKLTETIDKAAHQPGDWQVTKESTVSSTGLVIPGTREQKCAVCGQTLNTESYSNSVSVSQQNALGKAASYLRMGGFSYNSLVEQLEFEGFSHDDSVFAADHCGADWMDQVEQKARSYMKFMSFSRAGLVEQLEFEGFTSEQANHGADSVGL